MDYQQRGRLLVPIKNQVIPIGDLGLPIGGVSDLQFPDDLPPTLAINAVQTPQGPRLMTGTKLGLANQGLQNVSVVHTPAAETVTGQSAAINVAAYRHIEFYVAVTAISGTSPTFWPFVQGLFADGTYKNLNGTTAALTAVGSAMLVAGIGAGSIGNGNFAAASQYANQFPDAVRLVWSIGGTGPSVTFGAWLYAW